MEVFDGVGFVRLRSIERRGKYLTADIDGRGVCLSAQRGTHNTMWAVEHTQGPDGPSVLLRGAYGRYLFATVVRAAIGPSNSFVAAQADLEQQAPPPGMPWRATRRQGVFVIGCGLGLYLRANGRYRWWRRQITIAGDNGSTMMLWVIENVPLRVTRPFILDHNYQHQLRHRHRDPPTEEQLTRSIRFVCCKPNGDIVEENWRVTDIRTNKLLQLRITLASLLGQLDHRAVASTTICIRVGRFGRFSPLHIDLPLGNHTIEIVLVTHGTPVVFIATIADVFYYFLMITTGNDLRYPDLDAPQS